MWDRWLVYVSAASGGARALEGGSLDGFQASSTVTFDGFDLGGDVRSSFADFIAALRENGCDRLFLHCGTGYGSSRLPTGSPPDDFALVALPGEFIWAVESETSLQGDFIHRFRVSTKPAVEQFTLEHATAALGEVMQEFSQRVSGRQRSSIATAMDALTDGEISIDPRIDYRELPEKRLRLLAATTRVADMGLSGSGSLWDTVNTLDEYERLLHTVVQAFAAASRSDDHRFATPQAK